MLELWKQVRRFALQQANRWLRIGRGGVTLEDLQQTAFLGFLDALNSWDGNKGAFITWFSFTLKKAFTEATGQTTKRERMDPLDFCESLEEPLRDAPDSGSLVDIVPDHSAERAVEAVAESDYITHRRAAVRRALDGLPADQRRAVVLRYWRGESVDNRTLNAGLRALRHPSISRQLMTFL